MNKKYILTSLVAIAVLAGGILASNKVSAASGYGYGYGMMRNFSASTYAQMQQMHNLMLRGDYAGARAIMRSLHDQTNIPSNDSNGYGYGMMGGYRGGMMR